MPQWAIAEELFPGDTGDILIEQLAQDFQPRGSFGYRQARDFMYSSLDNHGGVVSGIYTDYQARIDPNSNTPRSDATEQDINAEHVWPQSRGATGLAKSDLHHLFPAKMNVNSARGNHPFDEIPDAQTRRWYRGDEQRSEIPTQEIDAYSESIAGRFEPREDRKGDVARAMFYFQTIYADQADQMFFSQQQPILCAWQAQDPVSEAEVTRSHAIATSQQGNENPFVLDNSLADRTYCLQPPS